MNNKSFNLIEQMVINRIKSRYKLVLLLKALKIKEINDKMIDLYLILTPVSGLLLLLTIINLKFALK
jgi:hypothetical protein